MYIDFIIHVMQGWKCTRIDLRAYVFSKISWGSMPKDPPSLQCNARPEMYQNWSQSMCFFHKPPGGTYPQTPLVCHVMQDQKCTRIGLRACPFRKIFLGEHAPDPLVCRMPMAHRQDQPPQNFLRHIFAPPSTIFWMQPCYHKSVLGRVRNYIQ